MVSKNTPRGASPSRPANIESLTRSPIGVDGLSEPQEVAWIEVIGKIEEVYADLVRDEVELEEKNAALEEAQRFIDSVLSSMSDLLIVCDRRGIILQVNDAVRRITGASDEDLVGAEIGALVLAATDGAAAPEVADGSDVEARLRTRDGASDLLSLSCTPRRDRRGRAAGKVVTGRPIGELKRAYEALERAHADLKQSQQHMLHAEKMVSIGRLVAGVAHELNNPISFVYANVHTLSDYAARVQRYIAALHAQGAAAAGAHLRAELRIDDLLADLPSLIEGAREGAERARDIVKGLRRMSFSGAEADEDVDIAEIVTSAVTWARRSVKFDVELSLSLASGLKVLGRASQLQQVAINIIQNAFDAMANHPWPRLDVEAVRDGEFARITFRDHGEGVPEPILSRIFDPFFTTKKVGEGTGLGLWVSYDIVRAHGGELTAANHPDGGAQFVLRLPAPRPADTRSPCS